MISDIFLGALFLAVFHNISGDNQIVDTTCKDKSWGGCADLKKNGFCDAYKEIMNIRCPETCGFCANLVLPLDVDPLDLIFENCSDVDPGRCKVMKSKGHCENGQTKHQLRKICKRTCGYCNIYHIAPQPPACFYSKHGCCWDLTTEATQRTPTESGCPICKDRRSSRFCNRFKRDCTNRDKVRGDDARNNCPNTCGLCGLSTSCTDSAEYANICGTFKEQGECKRNEISMSIYCKKTCEFCS